MDKENPTTAQFKVTQTMLDKCIIDQNKSIRLMAHAYDWPDELTLPSAFVGIDEEDNETHIKLYVTNRGDKRMSIKNLKKYAEAGDLVKITDEYHDPYVDSPLVQIEIIKPTEGEDGNV